MKTALAPLAAPATAVLAILILAACGGSGGDSTQTTGSQKALPGIGRPPVTIGDKNFTEQFVLGELYLQALTAKGFTVELNRNIGPTDVTVQALATGRIAMYPEYIDTWDSAIARYRRAFPTARSAYRAGQRYARAHGFRLLKATPFSDTGAIAVTFNYGVQNHVASLRDLAKISHTLTIGGPPQFQAGFLPALERVYGFTPAGFKALDIGEQYQALDRGTVQAAEVNTTDGELVSGNYTLLRDPRQVFGWGQVVPVMSNKAIRAEGPEFAATINKVTSLLSLSAIRQLNAAVDLSHEDPKVAATQFLTTYGILPAKP